jgi:hypothetical protein
LELNRLKSAVSVLLVGTAFAAALQANVYNAVSDFPISATNPNGVWSYWVMDSVGTQGFTSAQFTSNPGLAGGGTASGYVDTADTAILRNMSTGDINYLGTTWPNSLLLLHPGTGGQYSVVRFTAPNTGQYQIAALFVGLNSETSSDVHVVVSSDHSDHTANISGTQQNNFVINATLQTGDTIDFTVGNSGTSNIGDSTGFNALITPEPGFYGLLALGLAGLGAAVIRRHK